MSIIVLDEIKTTAPPRFATEEEFEAWCDEDTKADYVDGEVIVMTPESTLNGLSETRVGSLLEMFVGKNDLGFVFCNGLTQVRLRSGLRRNPDVIFVEKSRGQIIRENYIEGPPDLVMEFVSPESETRDWQEKFAEYEAAGVREYWVVDRRQKRYAVYCLGGDRLYHPIAPIEGKLFSHVIPGFWVKVEWFWRTPPLYAFEMAKEMGIVS
jgi:Uma2 family endonuclease